MSHHTGHYEAAFEDYLRGKGWPYVAVDEAHRALLANARVKNFDFLVYSESGPNLLVDVKGRKFPDLSRPARQRTGRAWENWVTADDIEGLTQWERVFGEGFTATFVFAYCLQGPPTHAPLDDVHFFRRNHYCFAAVALADYARHARPRSARWGTLAMPAATFRRALRDVGELL